MKSALSLLGCLNKWFLSFVSNYTLSKDNFQFSYLHTFALSISATCRCAAILEIKQSFPKERKIKFIVLFPYFGTVFSEYILFHSKLQQICPPFSNYHMHRMKWNTNFLNINLDSDVYSDCQVPTSYFLCLMLKWFKYFFYFRTGFLCVTALIVLELTL